MRKTIDISEVRRMGNHFLQHSEDEKVAERRATANYLESMLSHSGNYKGFSYTDIKLDRNGNRKIGDDSRRYYS